MLEMMQQVAIYKYNVALVNIKTAQYKLSCPSPSWRWNIIYTMYHVSHWGNNALPPAQRKTSSFSIDLVYHASCTSSISNEPESMLVEAWMEIQINSPAQSSTMTHPTWYSICNQWENKILIIDHRNWCSTLVAEIGIPVSTVNGVMVKHRW